MTLLELRDYLKTQRRVSLLDLTRHFDSAPDALRGMLAKWISKGKVRVARVQSSCGTSCCQCDPLLTEIYEWIELDSTIL